MRQFLTTTALLLSSIPLNHALNDFTSVFSTYEKGETTEIKWKDFSTTDLKSITVVPTSSGLSIPLTLPKCAESGKTTATCTRWANTGAYTFSSTSILLRDGSSYYFSLEYIEKSPSTKTGTVKSNSFTYEDPSASSSSSSSSSGSSKKKSKSKSKDKFGKIGKGGLIGIVVAVAFLVIILIAYVVVKCLKGKKKGAGEKGLGDEERDHEMGKQQAPLMEGKTSGDWSAQVPGDVSAGAALGQPEPYRGQGAAADYYAEAEKEKGHKQGA